MKSRDSRFNDSPIVDSSGNVFADLGFDEAEAEVMVLRGQVMATLGERVKK